MGNANQNHIDILPHLTPLRVVIIKKTSNNKYWKGCGRGRKELLITVGGHVN
jgi:hypothetical protein